MQRVVPGKCTRSGPGSGGPFGPNQPARRRSVANWHNREPTGDIRRATVAIHPGGRRDLAVRLYPRPHEAPAADRRPDRHRPPDHPRAPDHARAPDHPRSSAWQRADRAAGRHPGRGRGHLRRPRRRPHPGPRRPRRRRRAIHQRLGHPRLFFGPRLDADGPLPLAPGRRGAHRVEEQLLDDHERARVGRDHAARDARVRRGRLGQLADRQVARPRLRPADRPGRPGVRLVRGDPRQPVGRGLRGRLHGLGEERQRRARADDCVRDDGCERRRDSRACSRCRSRGYYTTACTPPTRPTTSPHRTS